MSILIGGAAGAAIGGAIISTGVGLAANAAFGPDGSPTTSGVMSSPGGSASSSSIQSTAPAQIGTSEAAKAYDPVEQMNKWNKIFNGFGEDK